MGRISFANIQKMIIIVLDRIEQKKYAQDFDSLLDVISTSLMSAMYYA